MVIKNEKSLLNEPFDAVLDWMSENPTLIYHYVDPLRKRMSEAYKEKDQNQIMEHLLQILYVDKRWVSEIEFGLLEEAIRGLVANATPTDHIFDRIPGNTGDHRHLLLIFLPAYDIVNGRVSHVIIDEHIKELYHAIIDTLFAFCPNPDDIVRLFGNFFKLRNVLSHAHDTTWFINIFKENKLDEHVSLEYMLLLFKHVSDMYTNREVMVDFFMKHHDLILGTYRYNNEFHHIEDRYVKYFGDCTREMISEIMRLIRLKPIDDVNKEIESFVIKYNISSDDKLVSASIVKCMVNDVIALLRLREDADIVRTGEHKVQDLIYQMWRLDKYVTNFVEITDDSPFSLEYLENLSDMDISNEATNTSVRMNAAEKKIYKAYRTYKSAEEKVDSQITKAVRGIKNVLIGDVRSEVIEGRKFSAIGLLKRLLGTVAIFSYSKIGAVVAIVVGYALKKDTRISERRRIIMELETEIQMITEKIEDARGDGNREAKYAMMRTKAELENALKKIRYGMEADTRSVNSAKALLSNARR